MHINTRVRTAVLVKKCTSIFLLCKRVLLLLLLALLLACAACSEKKTSISLTTIPAEIDFGSSQSTAQFNIISNNVEPVRWTISVNQPWVSFSETKGVASKTALKINVKIDRDNLSPGKKQAEIMLAYNGSQRIIPVSVFAVSQSQVASDVTTHVKKSQKNKVKFDLIKHADKNEFSPPENTTAVNFIDSGVLQTNLKTVTLNISAEDDMGIVAYYISDSDTKEQTLMAFQSKGDWDWKTINENKRYKGIISYSFKRDYMSGTEVYVNVWFKDVEGGVSPVAQDSIVFANAQAQQNNKLTGSQVGSQAITQAQRVESLPQNLTISQRRNEGLSSGGEAILLTQRVGGANSPIAGVNSVDGNSQNNNSSTENNDKNTADESVIYAYDFENGYNGWWVDNGQWEIGRSTVGPKGSCYKSVQCAGTVLSGLYSDYVESRIISPAITIPELGNYKRVQLKYVHWYALHLHDLAKLQISVETSPGVWSNWKTLSVQSGFARQWKISVSGLSNYAKKTIRLGFYLFQPPDKAGAKEGWYVDDISIVKVR